MRDRILEQGPRLRRIILVTTLLLVVLFFLRGLRDPFNPPKMAFLFIGTTLALAVRLAEFLQGAPRQGLGRFMIPAAAFSVPLTLSWLFSDHRAQGFLGEYGRFQGLVPYLACILFGALVADAFEVKKETLAWGFVSAGAFVGGYSIMQAMGLDPFRWSLGSGVTFAGLSSTGNPNFTGGLLGMTIPVCFGLLLTQRKRFPKTLPWCALLIVGGWLWAQSQGGWAAGIAGLAVTAGIIYADRIPFGRIAGWVVAGGVFAVSVGIAAVGNAMNLGAVPLTARLRGEWWVMAANMGMDRPLLGFGPDTFAETGMRYRTLKEAMMDRGVLPDTPHSLFMWFFACAGIVGAIGLLVLMGWVIAKARDVSQDNIMGAAFLGGAVAYFTQAFVSIDQLPLRIMGWALFGGLAATAMPVAEAVKERAASKKNGKKRSVAKARSQKKRKRSGAPLRWAPALIPLALVVLAVTWWSANLVLADYNMRRGASLFNENKYADGSRYIEQAIAFNNEQQYMMQYGVMLGDAGVATKDQSYFERGIAQFDWVDESTDIRGPVNRAHVYEQWMDLDPSKRELALADYERAYELDPYNPLSVTNLSDFLVRIERPEEALAIITPYKEIVEDPPPGVEGQWGDVYGSWAMALAADGQIEEAEEALAITREIAPEDRHISFIEQIIEIQRQQS
jgi:tetratricopeptide (TPR) repeat protein